MRALLLVPLVVLILILGAAWTGVHPSSFFQPSVLILVFGPLLAYLLLVLGPTTTFKIFQRSFFGKPTAQDLKTWDRLGQLGFLFGAMSVVVGFIHVFQHLADSSAIGAGVAVALTGLFYGAAPAVMANLLFGISFENSKTTRNYMGATTLVALTVLGTVIFILGNH